MATRKPSATDVTCTCETERGRGVRRDPNCPSHGDRRVLHRLPDVRTGRLDEVQPDPDNANDGTERGAGMLEHSLQALGAGRSIVLDKHGRVIAGNKTVEAAASVGLRDLIIVPTDGTQLVAVKRMDLDLAVDVNARALAIADNRVSEVDYHANPDALKRARDHGVDLSPFYSDPELDRMWGEGVLATPVEEHAEGASRVVHTCPACGHQWSGGDAEHSDS